MRRYRLVLAAGFICATTASLGAQTAQPAPIDRVTFDVAGGISLYGPHAFGGLEVALQRWLALRGEGLYSHSMKERWARHRYAALSLTGVVSLPTQGSVTPYLFGGYSVSVGQGYGMGLERVPLGGAGLRFRFGKLQPFVEVRAQQRIGVPISIGFRF
jgi:hypothetical protein